MRLRLFWIAVAAGLMLLMPEAHAQLSPQWRSCTGNPDVDWDQQIRSCSTLIQSGRGTTHKRAVAYNNRGNAYDDAGDHDRAIADYGAAIRLDGKNPEAYFNRGVAYAAKGDLDRAIADLNEAIQLDPTFAFAYLRRGLARRAQGNSAGADADIAKAKQLNPRLGN